MILMKDIVREGHPTLRLKADPVTFPLSEEILKIADDMLTFLHNSQDDTLAEKYGLRAGVGLAAPQIDVPLQIIALLVPGEYEDDPAILNTVMFNPKIIKHSVQEVCLKSGEGCLSVDREVKGYVPRYHKITVAYQDKDGISHEMTLREFPAIVVQHELDHLNGMMFYDRINKNNPFLVTENLKVLDY